MRTLLPPLTKGYGFNKHACWLDFTTYFATLPKRLNSNKNSGNNNTGPIASPWARLLLFADALNSEHPLHLQLTSHLLDVLELLFMQPLLDGNLEFVNINLHNRQERFFKLIADMRGNINLQQLTLVFFTRNGSKTLLAGVSPYTLFFTPPDIAADFTGQRWFNGVTPFANRLPAFCLWVKQVLHPRLAVAVQQGNTDLAPLTDFLGQLPNVKGHKSELDGLLAPIEQFSLPGGILLEQLAAPALDSPRLLACQAATPPLLIDENTELPLYGNYKMLPLQAGKTLGQYPRQCLPQEPISWPWLYPQQDLLAPNLLQLAGAPGDDCYHTSPQAGFLYPFTPLALQLFDVETLANSCCIDKAPSGYKVTLDLPLKSGASYQVTRFYNQAQVVGANTYPQPVLWPKPLQNWQNYYLYMPQAEGWELEIPLQSNITGPGRQNEDIYKLQNLPTHIGLNYNGKTGYLLLKQPAEHTLNRAETVLGIDFGTSNTMFAWQHPGLSKPQALQQQNESDQLLNPKSFAVLLNSGSQEQLAQSCAYRLFPHYLAYNQPGKAYRLPVSSSIRVFAQDEHPILSTCVVWDPFTAPSNATPATIMGGLKWDFAQALRLPTKQYLQQLFIWITYQLVSQGYQPKFTQVTIAYPKAFSNQQLALFKTMWADFCHQLGFGQPIFVPESKAAMQYFVDAGHLNRLASAVNVIADIGGGTSDLAFRLQDQELLFASLRFAGDDLALPRLVEYLEERFYNKLNSQAYKSLQNPKLKAAMHLASLSSSDYTELTATDSRQLRYLRAMILYFFAALIYEIATQLNNLPSVKGVNRVELFLAGNGARYLHWLALGNWFGHTLLTKPVQQFFSKVFAAGAPELSISEFELHLSSKPKAEVALGLCSVADMDAVVEPTTTLCLGENIFIDANPVSAKLSIDELGEFSKLNPRQISLQTDNCRILEFNRQFLDLLANSQIEDLRNVFSTDQRLQQVANRLAGQSPIQLEGKLRAELAALQASGNQLKSSLFIIGARLCLQYFDETLYG